MKLKKILASLTAAALAVSVVAFSPAVSQNMKASAETNPVTVASDVSLNAWANSTIDLTREGTPKEGSEFTIKVGNEITGNKYDTQVVFSIITNDWQNPAKTVTIPSDGVIAAGTEYTYSIADDLGGATSFFLQCGAFANTYTVTVSDVAADTRKVISGSYDGSPITMTKSLPTWCTTGTAQGESKLTFSDITYGETTLGEVKKSFKRISVDGIKYVGDSLKAGENAFNYCIYMKLGADSSTWAGTSGSSSLSGTTEWGVDNISGDDWDDMVIAEIGLQINMADTSNLPEAVDNLKEGETFTINPASSGEGEEEIIEEEGESDVEIKNNTDVEVSYDTATVLKAVLTADDLQAIADGKSVEVILNIKDQSSVSDEDKASAATLIIASQTIEQYLDITLTKSVNDVSAALTETAGLVPVTVTIPNYSDSKRYFVIRVHNGVPMYLESTVNDGKITFYSDKFSAFALVSEPDEVTPSDGTIWSGSVNQGINWEWNPVQVDADKCNFKAGDKLIISFTINNEADYHQLKVMDGANNVLDSSNPNEWGTVDVSSSPLTVTLSADDAAKLNANGITISGFDVTVTGVSASAGTTPTEPDKPEEPETPAEPETPVTPSEPNYSVITESRYVSTSASSAAAGATVNVTTAFGYSAKVYSGSTLIATIYNSGSFVMPSSNVRIVAVANGDMAILMSAKPVSYINAYDANMNKITTASTRKSKVDGEVTIKLGSKYAGKTVTLYSGKNSTSKKIDSAEADANGNVTFAVDLGKNYTAVVE